ncbi:MAG: RsmG family class I SAM-dependent methyltransferase [Elusimicrobiota bacterium]
MMPPMLKDEAADCLRRWGLELPDSGWELLDKYVKDVLEYNRRVNITAARDAAELMRRHVLDGMAAVAPLRTRLGECPRLLDVGAGAGFIGFGLKIAWPAADVTLMESSYRKYCFLNLASARLALPGLTVLQERAGPGTAGGYDGVLARALAPLAEARRILLPLVRPGGKAVVYQSDPPAEPGADWDETLAYRLPGESKDRHLVIFRRGNESA